MKRFKFILFLLVFSSLSSNSLAKMFDMSEFELDNGLKVIVVPNHKSPIVQHMIWYKVGSIDEKLGQSGKAHLLEHLLFRGTKKYPNNSFNQLVEEYGSASNAFTGYDYTAYYQIIDVTNLELVMHLEADRMQNLSFSEQSFKKEKDVVFQERKQVVENNPHGKFMENFRRSFWQEHPYGRPIIGTDEEIKRFDSKEVYEFYNKFYAPNNAILILSGDITLKEAKTLVNKHYGKLKRRNIEKRLEIKDDLSKKAIVFDMEEQNISYPRIYKVYRADSYNTNKKDIYALTVLSSYLGDGETSALYKDLVIKQRLANSVSTSYSFANRSYSDFLFAFIPAEGVTSNEAMVALDKAILKAIADLDDKKLEQIKRKFLSGLIYMRDNPADAANIVGYMSAIGMSLDEINSYDENISNVSLEEVKFAAKRLLANSHITGVLSPKSKEVSDEK